MNTLDIQNLLERYFNGETSLNEEATLRSYFLSSNVAEELEAYKPLFVCYNQEKEEHLGSDFDLRMLSLIDQDEPVKARTISLHRRFMPIMRAAAVVVFVLLLGNTLQTVFNGNSPAVPAATIEQPATGINVAMRDTASLDSMRQSKAEMPVQEETMTIK